MYIGMDGAIKTLVGVTGRYESVAFISGFSLEQSSDVKEVSRIGKLTSDAFARKQKWSASANGTVHFCGNGHAQLFRARQLGQKIRVQFLLRENDKDPIVEGRRGHTYFQGDGYAGEKRVGIKAI